MKKLISIVLSLCMLFSCVAYAQSGITAHIKVDTQGENVVDYTVSVAEDEDGCIQITANGTADGETQDIFLQNDGHFIPDIPADRTVCERVVDFLLRINVG